VRSVAGEKAVAVELEGAKGELRARGIDFS
jgi:hypothetical protein